MILTLEDVTKLNRKEDKVFLSAVPMHTLKAWKLSSIESAVVNNDVVFICYETLTELSSTTVQFENPLLLYQLPVADDTDEYPVILLANDHYLPKYCEYQLMSHDFINRLIEKSDKISVNSTKLMTQRSLMAALKHFDQVKIGTKLWPKLSSDLIQYFKSLFVAYPYLNYLPVAERKSFRKRSVADASFAWEMYIKFFIDEWLVKQDVIDIPNMKKPFIYKEWSGEFFNRDNPLWKEYTTSNGKFLFNDSVRDLIYQIWITWIREPE
ncbi:hypothetical protein [Paenibacillus lautus]|uniref:Uncharacterized protein n=1 Tax=Paenibacillus lautus TaxID=1401 RepID=A0A385TT32_PAELA|nr:hypothetical protein [Paenibacillus lautus]AYB46278.1 hypothetical protein D5F53_24595 [Paenibacillus lautus]